MTNYHINEKTGRVNICRAKPDNCPLKTIDEKQTEHFDNKETAQKFLEQKLSNQYEKIQDLKKRQETQNSSRPQDIEAATYIPKFNNLSDVKNYADYDYDYVDYYSYEIDEESYVIHSIDEEKLARDMVYRDAKMTKEDYEENLKEVKQMLHQSGALNTENYNLRVEYGYYDEHEISVEPKNSDLLIEKMKQEYYKKPNAKDEAGILEYVRSKGQATKGLSPVEAIREQLNNENKGRKSSLVEKSNNVSKRTLRVENIFIGAKQHYETIEAKEPVSENSSKALDGVVFYDKKSRTYRLIDGYHRTKNLNNNNRKTGNYIVLSE